jgi:hypothetical protein
LSSPLTKLDSNGIFLSYLQNNSPIPAYKSNGAKLNFTLDGAYDASKTTFKLTYLISFPGSSISSADFKLSLISNQATSKFSLFSLQVNYFKNSNIKSE